MSPSRSFIIMFFGLLFGPLYGALSRALAWMAPSLSTRLRLYNANDTYNANNAALHQSYQSNQSNPSVGPIERSSDISNISGSNGSRRTYSTPADQYYQTHGTIPLPPIIHDDLKRMLKERNARVESSVVSGVSDEKEEKEESEERGERGEREESEEKEVQSKNILIVGDVHGCLDELKLLIEKAERLLISKKKEPANTANTANAPNSPPATSPSTSPFQAIILVGDLVNKGPKSVETIRYIRNHQNFQNHQTHPPMAPIFAIRGNHDDASLAAALGDEDRRRRKSYEWVNGVDDVDDVDGVDGVEGMEGMSDEDVIWLSNLPYTIRISGDLLGSEDVEKVQNVRDVLVVHAGLDPNVSLEKQDTKTMVTIREVHQAPDATDALSAAGAAGAIGAVGEVGATGAIISDSTDQPDQPPSIANGKSSSGTKEKTQKIPWAKAYNANQTNQANRADGDSPHSPLIIFGHDAKRGLQWEYPNAIGLDTGCVYGKKLTGLILPMEDVHNIPESRSGNYEEYGKYKEYWGLVSVDALREYCPIKVKDGELKDVKEGKEGKNEVKI